MTSTIVDSFLQLFRIDPITGDAVFVTQNDDLDAGTKNARITFTATQSSYYAIFARSVPTTTQGPYTLTIQ